MKKIKENIRLAIVSGALLSGLYSLYVSYANGKDPVRYSAEYVKKWDWTWLIMFTLSQLLLYVENYNKKKVETDSFKNNLIRAMTDSPEANSEHPTLMYTELIHNVCTLSLVIIVIMAEINESVPLVLIGLLIIITWIITGIAKEVIKSKIKTEEDN